METTTDRKTTRIAIAIGSLMFTYWLVLPVALGAYADLYGFVESELGYIASSYSMGIFITTLLSALWINRVGHILQIISGSLVTSIGFLALYLLPSTEVSVIAVHFLTSIGLGITYAVVMILLADSADPTRAYASLFFTQVILGVVGNNLLTRWLNLDNTLPVIYLFMSAIGILCAQLGRFTVRLRGSQIRSGTTLSTFTLRPSLPIALGLASILLVFTGDSGVWVFLERIGSSILDRELGGNLVSINLLAGAIGSLTAAVVSNKMGYLVPMIIAIALSIISIAILNLASAPLLLLTGSFINGWAWNFGAAYRMALVSELDRDRQFVALIPAMQTLGNALGPLLVGSIIVWSSFTAAYWMVATLWILAMLCYYPAWQAHQSMVDNKK